jgi:hypothetical protein
MSRMLYLSTGKTLKTTFKLERRDDLSYMEIIILQGSHIVNTILLV